MKITASLAFVTIISAVALQLGSGYSIGGIQRTDPDESKLGDPCSTTSPCIGNTECTPKTGTGTCTCKDGFHGEESLNCIEGPESVGSTCKNEVGCEHLPNSKCTAASDKSTCQCLQGYHAEKGGAECVKDPDESKLGDPCSTTSPCIGNTECTPTTGKGTCTCKDGFHGDESLNCIEGPESVGSTCKNEVGCEHLPNSKCTAASDKSTCQCLQGYHAEKGGAECVKDPDESKLGDPCSTTSPCIGNAECTPTTGTGNCTCKDGFHGDESLNCIEGPEVVGSPCKNGVGCEHLPHSECSSANDAGTCKCSAGFHGDDGSTCTEDAKYGDDCVNGKGCESLINGKCSSNSGKGTCICNDGFYNDKNKECQKGKNLNDSCEEPNQCTFSYGKCIHGVCKCDEQHEEDTTSGHCVASLNGTCKDNSNCKYPITETCQSTGNSTAVKTCQCKEGYKEANDMCKAPNSGICDEGGCQDTHAECVLPNKNSNVTSCICKASYKLNKEGKCTGSAISVAFGALVLSLMTILTL